MFLSSFLLMRAPPLATSPVQFQCWCCANHAHGQAVRVRGQVADDVRARARRRPAGHPARALDLPQQRLPLRRHAPTAAHKATGFFFFSSSCFAAPCLPWFMAAACAGGGAGLPRGVAVLGAHSACMPRPRIACGLRRSAAAGCRFHVVLSFLLSFFLFLSLSSLFLCFFVLF